ncbi:MAG: transporter substrate-binding domain-containing protein [Magnetococcales bacterium]|nr:transporter substrate-binding domain-containing protein [Magnetococcales bacterium]
MRSDSESEVFDTSSVLRRWLILLIPLVLFVVSLTASQGYAQQPPNPFDLTADELTWLQKHPTIRIGVDASYAPYSFRDEDGHYRGIAMEYVDYLEKALNLSLEVVPDLKWPEIVDGVKGRDLDVVITMSHRPEREAFVNFTEIYLPTPLVIMQREGENTIQTESDLAGRTVALVKEYGSSARVLERYPDVQPITVETAREGLLAVATGKADAYVGVLGINLYVAQQNGILNLEVAALFGEGLNGQRYGVRKDWPQLAGILDKVLSKIPETEKIALFAPWLPAKAMQLPAGKSAIHLPTLTGEQKQWLLDHPTIRVGINRSWPPMDFVDASGRANGIGVDFIQTLNQRLGDRLTIVPGTWKEIYSGVQRGELDALMDITPRPDREELFNFTTPYIQVPHTIFSRKDNPYAGTVAGLTGRTVAVEKGFYIVQVLKQEYPTLTVAEHPSTEAALQAVSKGEADAYIGNRAVAHHLIRESLIGNLVEHDTFAGTSSINAIGVRKEWPILRDILQEALNDISQRERSQILENWVGSRVQKRPPLKLTGEERSWIRNHPVIRVAADPDFAPIESRQESGEFRGVAWDYLSALSEILGLTFKAVDNRNWPQLITDVQERRVDMFSAAVATKERSAYTTFTTSYLSLPTVIFTRTGAPFIEEMNKLDGKRIAVVKGFWLEEVLRDNHPGLIQVPARSVEDALLQVTKGQVDAYIDSLITAGHYIQEAGFSDIQVSGHTPYRLDLSMGARSDWPMLKQLLEKGIQHMEGAERREILGKWSAVTVKKATDFGLVIKVALVAGMLVLIFLIWNWSLRRQIHERIKAEHESRKLLSAVEQSPVAVVITDTDGVIEYINPSFTSTSGYTFKQAVGRNTSLLKSGETPHTVYQDLWSTILSGDVWTGELRNKKQDGTLYWEMVTIAPIRNEQGETTNYIAVKEDITQRKQDEEALQRISIRLKMALKGGNLGLWDADFVKNETVVNSSWFEIMGMEQRDSMVLPLTAWMETIHPEDQAHVRQKGEAFRDGKQDTYNVEFRVIKSGAQHWVVTKGDIFSRDEDGRPIRMVGTVEDITNRKQVERELFEAKQEADRANKAKSNFLANMSHEIRTPLNAIINLTHLVLETELESRQQDYLVKVETAGSALLGLINDILDVSKIEADGLELESAPFNFELVLENLANIINIRADQKQIEIHYNIDPSIPRSLIGDALRLQQVLINLMTNAIKFTHEGTIRLSAELVSVQAEKVEIAFAVKDEGIGIPEETLSQLFTPFTQADTSTTRKYGGTGLGLTICRRLVEMMEGAITVESRVGDGSTFSFNAVLELNREERRQKIMAPYGMRGLPVLLVDDSPLSLEVMSRICRGLDLEVTTARSAAEAEQLMTQALESGTPFRIVILDWYMPDVDGIELSKRLRTMVGVQPLGLVLLTAHHVEKLSELRSGTSLDAFLFKPVTPSLLLETVINVVDFHDPRGVAHRPSRQGAGGEKTALQGRILLVEDNEINREIAVELLKRQGLTVVEAEHGGIALELIESQGIDAFDLVLMDIQMPEMDGLEACRRIRLREDGDKIPIIAMTAHAMAGDREKSLDAGMNDHIAKPVVPRELYASLGQWLEPSEGSVDAITLQQQTPQELQSTPNASDSLPGTAIDHTVDSGASFTTAEDAGLIEWSRGLRTVGGDMALYERILGKFIQNQEESIQQMDAALETGDLETMVRNAHTVKGVSATIGAITLSEQAARLEQLSIHATKQDVPDRNEMATQLESVTKSFEQVCAVIHDRLSSTTPLHPDGQERNQQVESYDVEKVQALVEKAIALLEVFDTDVESVLNILEPIVQGTPHEETVVRINNALETYDYETALEIFKQWHGGE